jgi:uncharacterized protein
LGRRAVAVVAAALLVGCASHTGALPAGIRAALAAARPAGVPFDAFTATSLRVGGRCRRVLVADTEAERVQGLRAVRSLRPYDGMLFVFDRPTRARFTMADTRIPLAIAFYDDRGLFLRALTMRPCSKGTDATCPVYDPHLGFRFALETREGGLTPGALAGC